MVIFIADLSFKQKIPYRYGVNLYLFMLLSNSEAHGVLHFANVTYDTDIKAVLSLFYFL